MSYRWNIVTDVQTVVMALSALSDATSAIRERPFCSEEHGDVLPFLCLSSVSEKLIRATMANTIQKDYTHVLAYFQKKSAVLQSAADQQKQFDVREAIEKALHKGGGVLPTVATVTGCEGYDPEPAFDLAGLDKLFTVSLQLFTFRNTEPRSV